MMPRVAVTGGSVGGLTAALVLRDAGCDVTVFERSSAALQARGAGIATLEATLRYLTERGGRQVADVCSSTNWIRFLRADGSVRHEQRHRYLFSSWNTIYRSLLGLFDPGRRAHASAGKFALPLRLHLEIGQPVLGLLGVGPGFAQAHF